VRACSTRQESCAQTRPQAGGEAIADCTCILGAICDGRAMRSAPLLTNIGRRSPGCSCGDRSITGAWRLAESKPTAGEIGGRSTFFEARPSSLEQRLARTPPRSLAACE